jgi:hypothetical protein
VILFFLDQVQRLHCQFPLRVHAQVAGGERTAPHGWDQRDILLRRLQWEEVIFKGVFGSVIWCEMSNICVNVGAGEGEIITT